MCATEAVAPLSRTRSSAGLTRQATMLAKHPTTVGEPNPRRKQEVANIPNTQSKHVRLQRARSCIYKKGVPFIARSTSSQI